MKIVTIIKIVAVLTLFSGLVQMVFPTFVLELVGGKSEITSAHFFGIVGMFMALFGGLLMQATTSFSPHPQAILWCGLQKAGASAAIPLGVMKGVFSVMALGVAAFDLFSAIIILVYWNSLRKSLTL